MYTVLIKSEIEIPTVISQNNVNYPDYLMAGWEVIFSGTKRDCQEIASDMLTAYAD